MVQEVTHESNDNNPHFNLLTALINLCGEKSDNKEVKTQDGGKEVISCTTHGVTG